MNLVRSEPLVVKMASSLHRISEKSLRSLREILGPVVVQIIESANVDMELDPVKIYHNWKKEMEVANR